VGQIGQERMNYQSPMGGLGKQDCCAKSCCVNGGAINSSHQGMKHILLDILSLESNEVLIMDVLFGILVCLACLGLFYFANPFKSDTFWGE